MAIVHRRRARPRKVSARSDLARVAEAARATTERSTLARFAHASRFFFKSALPTQGRGLRRFTLELNTRNVNVPGGWLHECPEYISVVADYKYAVAAASDQVDCGEAVWACTLPAAEFGDACPEILDIACVEI